MKKVIIIGGGFAGSQVAMKLENYFDTILIDNKDYFEYTPGILRIIVEPEKTKRLQIPHNKYLKKARLIKGEVAEVGKNYIKLTKNKKKINFDYLVISSGSSYKTPMIGTKIINSMKTDIIKNNYNELLKSKKVLIIGGGIVGVELAAEIATNYKKEMILIHSKERLIPRINLKASKYAEKFLRKYNVNIILNERVIKSYKNNHNIKNKIINSDITFYCLGITPNSIFMERNFKNFLDEKKFIKVNNYLQLDGFNNIFVAGDVNNINEEKLAQNAEIHAKIISKNIINIENNKPLLNYNPKPRVVVISLGKYNGILAYKNITMTGIIPGILKNLIEFWIIKKYK